MDEALFSTLVINSDTKKKEAAQYAERRYLYDAVKNVPKGYFAGVCGLRGIGKSVLLLQMANETENSLYFSADASYLREQSLYEITRFAAARGYGNIFIDEIHYQREWQRDLKTIYDEGEARVFFSGSAALEIKKGADLSRRALLFHMEPLSFREYLIIKKRSGRLPVVSALDLFDTQKRKEIATQTSKFSTQMQEYFVRGGLLYPSDDIIYFYKALENTLEKIIHSDLEYLRSMDMNIENVIYKVLEWIAISPVGEVNYSSLSSKVSVSKPTLIRIVDDLAKVGLIRSVLPCGKDSVRKEPKLYLAFPFREYLCSVFSKKADLGSLREEFFVNHAPNTCYMKGKRGEKTPDFTLEGKILEIGGGKKGFYQRPDFVVRDAITFEENALPLYLTGFLY